MMIEPVWYATLSPEQNWAFREAPTHELLKSPDLLVVGAGIVGLAIAHCAAEAGMQVQVIDRGPLAAGATAASLGGIWPNDQGPNHPEPFQSLAFLSRDLWGRLSLRLSDDFDWRVNGFLNVNPSRLEPSAPRRAGALQAAGYAVQAVDATQIAELEPALAPGLEAGLLAPSEAHVNPLKAALALARAAQARGACLATGVSAHQAIVRGGQVAAVETSAGRVTPRHVVSAAGWSAEWLNSAGCVLPPLQPVSGQLISTDPLPPLLRSAVAGEFLVLQLRSGQIVTGGNVEEGTRLVPDAARTAEFASAAIELLPALRDVPVTRSWCGLRPATPDGLPVIDRASAAGNLWLACGHFRNGVLLAPATARLLCDWIASGIRPTELAAFGLERFEHLA